MNNNFNNFNNMDDLFNQLMGGMWGYSSEIAVTWLMDVKSHLRNLAHYRATGQFQEMQKLMAKCQNRLQVWNKTVSL